jgi:hypothetical protein
MDRSRDDARSLAAAEVHIGRRLSRYVIASAADARQLLAGAPWLGAAAPASVVVELPELKAEVRQRMGARLTLWLTACGCVPGGLVAMLAIVWRATIWLQHSQLTLREVCLHLGWILAGGVAGKVIGLACARLALACELVMLGRGRATRPLGGLERVP